MDEVQPDVIEGVIEEVIQKAKEDGVTSSAEVKDIIDDVVKEVNPDLKDEDIADAIEDLQPDLVAGVLEAQKEGKLPIIYEHLNFRAEGGSGMNESPDENKSVMTLNEIQK
jgi:hypothetical protein